MQEAGKIAKAVNIYFNPKFKPKPVTYTDSAEHKTVDCLIYLIALSNSLGFDLMEERLTERR